MFSSSWTTMYNAFVDESYCAEEPSATRHTPKAAPAPQTPYPFSALKQQELDYAATVSPGYLRSSADPSTDWDGESYLSNVGFSRVRSPKETRRPQTSKQSRRYTPYLYSPSKAQAWKIPTVISPGDVPLIGTLAVWDAEPYRSGQGISGFRRRIVSIQDGAEVASPRCPPRPDARNDDDPFRELADLASSPAVAPPSADFFASSPFHSGSSLSSLAASATPPGAAGSEQEGESSGAGRDGEPQSDGAAVTNPANATTHDVHSQQGAAGGVATAVGTVVLPFPVTRNDLFDLFEQGLHAQCLLPSVRHSDTNIVCMGKHYLGANGIFEEPDTACQVSSGSEDTYGRHIRSVHLKIPGRGSAKEWILSQHPAATFVKETSSLVVEGARTKGKDRRTGEGQKNTGLK